MLFVTLKAAGIVPSANRRFPLPTVIGNIISQNTSTRSCLMLILFLTPHRPTIGGPITGSYCFWDLASRKSFTIGTIVDMRFISVTCVVSGKIASLDADRGCMSP